MLKFSKANAKLDQLHDVDELQHWLQDRRKVYSFDLIPAGHAHKPKIVYPKLYRLLTSVKSKTAKIVNSVVSLHRKKLYFLLCTITVKQILTV